MNRNATVSQEAGSSASGSSERGGAAMDGSARMAARLQRVADGVHAYVQPPGGWCVNNAGIVVDGGQCAVVDTAATRARADGLRAAVRTLYPAEPALLVNTHHHSDHTFGNVAFAPETLIVANERTRTQIIDNDLHLQQLWPDVPWGDVGVRPPTLTFDEALTVRVGGLRLELFTVGPAHTAADLVIWIPDRRVLFAGDVALSQVTPFTLMGSVRGSLAALERLRRLEPDVVVPGHGPVTGPEVLDANIAYFRWVAELVHAGERDRRTALDIARDAEPGPFRTWLDGERLVANVRRGLAEAAGLAPGEPLDIGAAFAEIIAFNGSLPTCHA